MPPVTIRDVATTAGVSIKTVSRVLNNEPFVKDSTRLKVLAAIDELGYVASLPARRLASGQSFTIGLIFHNASWHYLLAVQRGVLDTARKSGYSTLLHSCDICSDADAKEILNLVRQKVVDGFIFTPPVDNASDLIQDLQDLQVPFVRLTPVDQDSPLPFVTTTDLRGAYEMTQYLISLGHRKIGFIHGPQEQRAGHERFNGYQQAMADAGLLIDTDLIIQGDDHFESGTLATQELLKSRNMPTAIFCNNDEMAAGCISAIFEAGLMVPQDISVVGFDNAPLASQIWPPLTTVNQPIYELAEMATHLLISILKGDQPTELCQVLKTELIIRKSTAAINNPHQEDNEHGEILTPIHQGI